MSSIVWSLVSCSVVFCNNVLFKVIFLSHLGGCETPGGTLVRVDCPFSVLVSPRLPPPPKDHLQFVS